MARFPFTLKTPPPDRLPAKKEGPVPKDAALTGSPEEGRGETCQLGDACALGEPLGLLCEPGAGEVTVGLLVVAGAPERAPNQFH